MTMPEILRRKLMERIDIASEPDDGEVLEEIDRLILGEEETRYLPVSYTHLTLPTILRV